MSQTPSPGWKRLLIFLNSLSIIGVTLVLYANGDLKGPTRSHFIAQLPFNKNYDREYSDSNGKINWEYGEENYSLYLELTIYNGAKHYVPLTPLSVNYKFKLIDNSNNKKFTIKLTPSEIKRYKALDEKAINFYKEAAKKYWRNIFNVAIATIGIPTSFVLFLFGIAWVFRGFKKT